MCKPIGNFDVCKQIGLCRVSYNNKKNSHRLTDTRAPDWRPIRAWHWALISSDATDPGLSRHLLDPLCTPIKRTWHESRLNARARFDPVACVSVWRCALPSRMGGGSEDGASRERTPRRPLCPARLIGVQRGSRRCLDSPGLVSSDEMSAHARIGRMGVCGSVKVFNAFDPFIWYITTRTEKPVIQRHFRLSSCLVAINITSFCKPRTQT